MKLLLGIIIGGALVLGGTAFAAEHGIIRVSQDNHLDGISKWYDYDNGIVCYSIWTGNGVGLSCLHN